MATQTTNLGLVKPADNETADIQVINNNMDIIDTELTPTADSTQSPSGNGPGKLVQWVSWLTNRIKAITGKTNWWDTPSKTLEDLNTHINTAAPHSGHETPAGAQAKANAAAAVVQANLDSHLAESTIQIASGTANAITVTTGGNFTYTQGKCLKFKATADNTGNVTLNVDNKGAVPLLKLDGSQIPASGIKSGKVYEVYYDSASGGRFFVLPKASGSAVASDVRLGKTFSNDSDSDIVGTLDLTNLIPANIVNGVNIAGVTGTAYPPYYMPGDNPIYAENVIRGSYSQTEEEILNFTVNNNGTIRAKYIFNKNMSSGTAYLNIYKNSVLLSNKAVPYSSTDVTYVEDWPVNAGDVFSIKSYINSSGGYTYRSIFKQFKLCVAQANISIGVNTCKIV
ncbi:hypothetical protein SAMN05443428_1355 [Caloramator quimbayensis]|uniref:Uncharacterized protein n=1 Tax=Caloramator quimbayensis TaxID=1147123 RepID=A0A1T4YC06_9CLOT|nr:hypothetical protein [Caloramator quimbayensis]SKA99306.1 hypothetical protein SAMN05443428_1355 [Caloramator quimbayensis]